MITPLTEPSINKSVVNRHTYVTYRKNRNVRQPATKTVDTVAKKPKPPKILKKDSVKAVIKTETQKPTLPKELPKIPIKEIQNQVPIKEEIEPKPIKTETIEEAINEAVRSVPVERKVNAEQHKATTVSGINLNGRSQYSYNSILGTCVLHN